jgi:hypothetical protein
MLDLHASPQLTGTRFENPDWRKHLPSLKPIGLASMLTYACVGEDSSDSTKIALASGAFRGGSHSSQEPEASLQRRISAETELVRHVKLIPPMECLRLTDQTILHSVTVGSGSLPRRSDSWKRTLSDFRGCLV